MTENTVLERLAQRPNMIKLVTTDNACNKVDQTQNDIPLGNNQGCHSRLHCCKLAPVLNCRPSPTERPHQL